MNADIRALVLEQGSSLTHDLTVACRRAGVFILGPVRDVAEAQAAALEMSVDVLVVELSGPSVNVLREAAETLGGVRILGATDDLDPDVGAAVIAAGGTGLLPRNGSIATMVDALRRAAAGELVLPDTHLAALPPRLRPVLTHLLDGHGEKQVAAQLGLSRHTVHEQVKAIYRAIGVNSRAELFARFLRR